MHKEHVGFIGRYLILMLHLSLSTSLCDCAPLQIYMDADPLATSSNWLDNWTPTFEKYLTSEVSRAMGFNVSFQLHHYDGSTPMDTLVEQGLIDFYYGAPNFAACLQARYSAVPILTVRKPMPGGGNIDAYGGAMVVSASNHKINSVEDIKGAVVGVQLQSGWASNLLQKYVLSRSGIDLFRDSKQVISGDINVSFAQLQILKSVQSGLVDVGFVRADNLYVFQTRGQIHFKIIGQVSNTIPGTSEPYPFPMSTKLYPEWALSAYPTVDRKIKLKVLEALLKLNSSFDGAIKAGYYAWELPLDYGAAEQVLQDTNVMIQDPTTGRRQCQWLVKGYREYDSPSCPAGTFKVTEAEAVANCRLKNISCIAGLHCWCGVCKQTAEYEMSISFQSGKGQPIQTASCSKMQICAAFEQGLSFQAMLLDNLLRSELNFTYRVTNLGVLESAHGSGHFQAAKLPWVYNSENVTLSRLGLYSIEVAVDGAQIDSSPYLVSVTPAKCGDLRAADDVGNCQCASGAVPVGGGCVMLEVILFSVFFPIAGILVAINCYLRFRPEDDSERTLRHMMGELRKRLRINRRDGFALSTERVSSNTVAIICKSHMEAAARLALWQDFDVKHFDAFCVCLRRDAVDGDEDDDDSEAKLTLMRTLSIRGRDQANECLQYGLLQQWLLDISRELLDPAIDGPGSHGGEGSSRKLGSSVHGSQAYENGGVVERSSQEQRYRYFHEKLIQCQIWREGRSSIFRRLKGIAQELMNVVAQNCDARYSELGNDPEGDALVSYESLGLALAPHIPDLDDVAPRQRFPSMEHDTAVSRQDHAKIGAIRVLESDKVESSLLKKMALPVSFCGSAVGSFQSHASSIPNEEVFACQLTTRAHLLNEAFQAKVVDVIRKHAFKVVDADYRLSVDMSHSNREYSPGRLCAQSFVCNFKDGAGPVEVYAAPIKKFARMREKIAKYAPPHPKGVWPLTANILDPVRSAVVCNGPSQILEVQRWFTEDAGNGLPVCRIKNKFARSAVVEDGYRDLSLSVAFIDHSGLRIIGEVQIHDMQMHNLKLQMHKFYTIKRAADAGGLAG